MKNGKNIKVFNDDSLLVANISTNMRFNYWMDSKEAAEYLRISTKTLLNLVSMGKIPYYKLGRRNRYKISELQTVILGDGNGGGCGY